MNSFPTDIKAALAQHINVSGELLSVDLVDGRTISVPLTWYPRLFHATEQERQDWRLIGEGEGIHWPELDEDISIQALLAGRPSAESSRSLARWLQARETRSQS